MDSWVSIYKASKIFKVSRNKIKRLIRDDLIQKNKDGKILVNDVKNALELDKQIKEEKLRKKLEYKRIIDEATSKYKSERAKLMELQRKEKEGILIDKREVEKILVEIGYKFKKKLLSWRSKLPPILINKTRKEIDKILSDEVDELMEYVFPEGFHKIKIKNKKKA